MDLYNITENSYGVFPDIIPVEAKDIEYFYTVGNFFNPSSYTHTYLKMTVSQEYLESLLEVIQSKKNMMVCEQDCSVLTQKMHLNICHNISL